MFVALSYCFFDRIDAIASPSALHITTLTSKEQLCFTLDDGFDQALHNLRPGLRHLDPQAETRARHVPQRGRVLRRLELWRAPQRRQTPRRALARRLRLARAGESTERAAAVYDKGPCEGFRGDEPAFYPPEEQK